MSDFLQKFMRVAQQITSAERALAVNLQLQVIGSVNFEPAELDGEGFAGLSQVETAIKTGETLITNNVVTDPSKAPNTNTSFTELRAVIVIPVPEHGALYLDQRIRNGIIPKKTVENLCLLYTQALEAETDYNEEQLRELYAAISA